MAAIIYTTKGVEILVDDDDYELLKNHKWYLAKSGYVKTAIYDNVTKKSNWVMMHRLIMSNPEGFQIDHINRNKLDNRKENLRKCTPKQNRANTESKITKTKSNSIYKGLSKNKAGNFRVTVRIDNKDIQLGTYSNEIAAANVYNRFVKEYYGEFAWLNDVHFMSEEECDKYKYKKTSVYYGVNLMKGKKEKYDKWVARIRNPLTKEREHLGCFDTEEEAALSYNKRAIELYGNDFDKLNIIEDHRFIFTYTGKKFYPFDPKIEDFDIEDIAHVLSRQCRFGGHCGIHYSVAQHSLNCANMAKELGYNTDIQLYLAGHDMSEAYLVDIPSPIKAFLPEYKELESKVQSMIWTFLGLNEPNEYENQIIKYIDSELLAWEGRHLTSNVDNWTSRYKSQHESYVPPKEWFTEMEFNEVKRIFKNKVLELKGEL